MKKKVSELKVNDSIRVWVDSDIVGNPIYHLYKVTSLPDEKMSFSVVFDGRFSMTYIAKPDQEFEVMES